MELEIEQKQVKWGLTASQLKTIAIVAMIIDHIAWAFVPMQSALGVAMHFVGRITGPTMFFFIAEGYHHTRNANKYTLRLGIFALISWLPFYYFEFGRLPSLQSYAPVGVIYTLFLALLAVRARHEIKNGLLRVVAILACIGLSVIGDWPIYGVVITLLFDIFRGNYKRQFISISIVFLTTILPPFIGLINAEAIQGVQNYIPRLISGTIIQIGQFLPLILLRFYNGQRGGGGAFSKWFFYIIYPLHLLIIGFIRFNLLGG